MKRKIFLLLMFFIFSFIVHSESISNNDIGSMVETFLNKGTYIKEYSRFDKDKNTLFYYPKNYITSLEYKNTENSIVLYIDRLYIYVDEIRAYSYTYSSDTYNFSLDDNYNLIIEIK